MVSGRVAKHYGLASELFSALMLGGDSRASASASLSLHEQTGSLHAMLLLGDGLFSDLKPELAQDVPMVVTLHTTAEGGRETRVVEERLKIPQVQQGVQ